MQEPRTSVALSVVKIGGTAISPGAFHFTARMRSRVLVFCNMNPNLAQVGWLVLLLWRDHGGAHQRSLTSDQHATMSPPHCSAWTSRRGTNQQRTWRLAGYGRFLMMRSLLLHLDLADRNCHSLVKFAVNLHNSSTPNRSLTPFFTCWTTIRGAKWHVASTSDSASPEASLHLHPHVRQINWYVCAVTVIRLKMIPEERRRSSSMAQVKSQLDVGVTCDNCMPLQPNAWWFLIHALFPSRSQSLIAALECCCSRT